MIKSLKNNPKELRRLYIDEGLSLSQIAEECEVAFQTVHKWLKHNNIASHGFGHRPKGYVPPHIAEGEKEELRKYYKHKPLSPEHRKKAIEALSKNWVRGEKHPSWKGGSINKGYRLIRVDGKRVSEHRHLMEQHLGRKLTKREDVHHINKNTLDNRIENLMVLTKSEHQKLHWKQTSKEEQKKIIANLNKAKALKKQVG